MRFFVLGPLEVRSADGLVTLGGIKLRALLAVLLLHSNEPVSAERLALALWGEDVSGGATKTVQVHVSRLRRALGKADLIATTAAGYCARVRPGELDVAQFERLVADGRRALAGDQPEQGAAVLREALGLWRGPALAGLENEPFAPAEITRLEEQRLAALEARVEADLAVGGHAELVAELRHLVAVHPTRERFAVQLMLALYRCGRQSDALEAYQETRRVLVGDVGVEPGSRLRDLQNAILRHDAALEPRASAPSPRNAPHAVAHLATTAAAGASSLTSKPVTLALPRSLQAVASTPFVGRDTVLEQLHKHWTAVQRQAHPAVFIAGEAGIGKTRLASEFAHTLHETEALVLYGRCDDGLAAPYQPFVEALRPYARAAGLDRLRAALGDLAPELGRLLPELAGLGEPVRGDPESERFALFEAVVATVEAMTREQPALLVLDDLHWAAAPTLMLLRHLIRSDRPLGALVLCTYRETELDASGSLAQLLADLQRDASAQRLSIGGLNEPAIAALLEATIGRTLDERTSQLVHVLAAQTAGNPFFIRELLAHVIESDAIHPEREGLSCALTAAQLEAPEGLRQVIGHRVARLSGQAGDVLRIAAVAGATFSFALLERVLGEDVLDSLDEALAAGLLTETGHGDYAFAHALVRQTLYEQLSAARRMRLHRQIGDALESLRDADAHLEALAYHFAQAASDGQGAKAADYALAAGRNAAAQLGYEEAIAHYERGLHALTLTGQPQEQQRCELLLALGEARWGTGEPEAARQASREAIELADTLRDTTVLARAALGFDGPYRFEMVAAMHGPITALLKRALGAIGEADTPLRAQLLGRLAAHTEDRAPALAREALQLARRVADKATLADVLTSYLWAARSPDALHESLAVTRELRDVANELGDRRLEAAARVWLFDLLLELGDIDGVERELEAVQRLAETRKDRYLPWVLATRQANYALLCGRLEECERLARDVMAHDFEGPAATAMLSGVQMLCIRSEQGRLDELIEDIEGFAESSHPLRLSWRCAVAYVHALLERTAQARQELDVLARAGFEDLPRDGFWLSNVSTLSQAVAILGDTARARLLHSMLLPYADRYVVAMATPCLGSACRHLGLLATTLARYDDAERHLEQAMKMNIHIRSPLWIAHTQHDYARLLLLRNRAGDRDQALQLLTEVLATACECGLTALADRAQRLELTTEATNPSLSFLG